MIIENKDLHDDDHYKQTFNHDIYQRRLNEIFVN